MKEIKDRILGSEKIAWKKLKPFQPENLKVMSKESFELLKNSITSNDFNAAFDIWKENDENLWILDGHHRRYALEALEKDGYVIPEKFSCTIIDCKDSQDACYVIASKASSHAKMDELGFAEWATLNDLDFDRLKSTLDIPDIDIDKIWNQNVEQLEPQSDEDEVPELKIEATTKPGDIWILGNHRLLCGDSINVLDVEKLLNNTQPDMVYTDPPYGIDENTDRVRSKITQVATAGVYEKIIGDDSTQTAIDAYNLCASFNIPVMVFWGANYYAHSLPETGNWLVWDKREEDKQRDVNSDAELAWVKSRFNSVRLFRHLWKGMIKASEHGEGRIHPTQKPVALAEWCFDEYSKESKTVFDLFGGSGSTLIACEKTNRTCLMIEISPAYCDQIIKRWQKYTGKKATHEDTKQTFDELSPLV